MVNDHNFMAFFRRRIHWYWWVVWLSVWLVALAGLAEVQAAGTVRLQIRLRHSDGTAVTGESIILQRLPDEEPVTPTCTTNSEGECTWQVRRGLYQLLFDRPLDDITALALAEGGLNGLGITVGDEPITYSFTFHSDGHAYFDAAPEAAVPSPIIPVGEMLHGGVAPTPTSPAMDDQPLTETPTIEPTTSPETAVDTPPDNTWHFLLFIAGGLIIGGSIHWWSSKRQSINRKSEDADD